MRPKIVLAMAFLFTALSSMVFAQTQIVVPRIVVTPSVTAGIAVRAGATTIPSVPQVKLHTLSNNRLQATLPGLNGQTRTYTASSLRVQSGTNQSMSVRPSNGSVDRVVMRLRDDQPTIVVVPCEGKHANHEECSEHVHAHPHHLESYCDYDEHKTDPRCGGVNTSRHGRN